MSDVGRIVSLCKDAIQSLQIDLTGYSVYTEAGTGPYRVTAPLAAATGAKSVIAIAGDSGHGSRDQAIHQTAELADELHCRDRIEFVKEKTPDLIGKADIITNSGFVRPITAEVVSWMKPTAVIPLMYEAWEFRERDVDLEACWKKGIPVAGTNESDERVRTMDYLGPLALKLLLENRIEIFRSGIVLIGGGEMANRAAKSLQAIGANVSVVARSTNSDGLSGLKIADSLASTESKQAIKTGDAILVIEHRDENQLIGPDGDLTAKELAEINEDIQVVHVCGSINGSSLSSRGIACTPRDPAQAGDMSYTLGYVGPRPIINLQAAGLRVGQYLADARTSSQNLVETMDSARQHGLVDDFDQGVKAEHGFPKTS